MRAYYGVRKRRRAARRYFRRVSEFMSRVRPVLERDVVMQAARWMERAWVESKGGV